MHYVYHCRDFPGRYIVDVPRSELLNFLHQSVFVPHDRNTVVGIEGYWKSVHHLVTIHVHTTSQQDPLVRVFSPRVSEMVHERLASDGSSWATLEKIVVEQLDLDDEKYTFSLTHVGTKNAIVIPNPRCVRNQLRMFDYETLEGTPVLRHRVYHCRAFPGHYMMDVPKNEIHDFLNRLDDKENDAILGIGGYWKAFQSQIVMFVRFPSVSVVRVTPPNDAIAKALDCYNDRWEALKKMIADQLELEQDTYMLSITHEGKEMIIPSQRFVEKQLQVYNYEVESKKMSDIFTKMCKKTCT